VVCATLAVVTVGAGFLSAAILGSTDADMAAAGSAMAGVGAASAVMGLAMLFGLAFLLWVGLTPSQPGENRFGPPAQPVTGPPPAPPIVEP